ncbi:type II toxin-antitoxin system RelE/ParE family toxin [Flavobacterium sp. DGU11]|uniref:Type II toxin-antitoxin system RelE/ParE family toxin n=1 Tax=Flavobacterium arundinis TaxID=3139143 RepID=A0ABU9HSY8_9FLAO
MAYKIVVSPTAQIEIYDAMDYYDEISISLTAKFYADLQSSYSALLLNPDYRIFYNKLRMIPLKKFPFILLFTINGNEIVINACFHTSKNPKKYPGK